MRQHLVHQQQAAGTTFKLAQKIDCSLPFAYGAGNFASLRCILESPLPRVYEEGQDGAVPADDQQPIGRGVATELVTEAAGMMRNRLEKEVIAPLKLWTQSYKAVQVHTICRPWLSASASLS